MPSPPSDDRPFAPPQPASHSPSPAPAADPALAETRPHADRAQAPDRPVDPLIGQCVRAYRIVRELGRGGMGVVYAAEHVDIGQRAAVKTLNLQRLGPSGSDPAIAQRFLTEAKALAIARHPGLVQLFDYGQLPDGTLFLLMEYLEGESLADRRERQRRQAADSAPCQAMAPVEAVRIGRQLADALGVAHEKGIFHRDLKPSNVFLVADSEAPAGERVKILDFGLARIAQTADAAADGAPASPARTSTSVIMGTPLYMAPEQCRGLAHADGRADVYSLGVLLYELLAGTPPFTGNTTGELIAMHIYQQPVPLSRRAPGVPRDLSALVMRMLRKDPEQRPLISEVGRVLRAIEASGLAAPARRPLLAVLSLVVTLSLVAGGLMWWRRTPMPAVVPSLPAPVKDLPSVRDMAGAGSVEPSPLVDARGNPDAAAPILEKPAALPSWTAPASATIPGKGSAAKERPLRPRASTGPAAAHVGTPAAKPSAMPAAAVLPAPPAQTPPPRSGSPSPSPAASPDEDVHVPALR